MPTHSCEPELEQAVSEVLGTMFFADVLGKQSCDLVLAPADDQMAVKVEFRGEESQSTDGEMRVVMPAETASALAANFLGLDLDDISGEQLTAQVLGELGNMLCGAYLSRVHGEQIYKLSPPERMPVTPAVEHCYQLDSGAIGLSFQWRGEAPRTERREEPGD